MPHERKEVARAGRTKRKHAIVCDNTPPRGFGHKIIGNVALAAAADFACGHTRGQRGRHDSSVRERRRRERGNCLAAFSPSAETLETATNPLYSSFCRRRRLFFRLCSSVSNTPTPEDFAEANIIMDARIACSLPTRLGCTSSCFGRCGFGGSAS